MDLAGLRVQTVADEWTPQQGLVARRQLPNGDPAVTLLA
jgi:hypothetical protein